MRLTMLILVVAAVGCSNNKDTSPIQADPSTGASAGGTAGASGQGGNSGASDLGGAAGTLSSAGAAGAVTNGPCPSGQGPDMVAIPTPDGSRFCIDSTEVTRGQYAQFLADKKDDTSGQTAECAKNSSYQPKFEPPPQPGMDTPLCPTHDPLQPKQPSTPMVCIDWCDAKAYCSWAGKRLCGKIGGGQLSMDGRDDPAKLEGTNPNISEWGFACSQGAKTTYPYGNEHQEGACVDVSYRQDHKLALSSNADVKSDPSCHGQSPPYDALWDMVENVNEFEDGFSAPDVVGFRVAYKNGFTCDSEGALDISATNAQVGFRCCAD